MIKLLLQNNSSEERRFDKVLKDVLEVEATLKGSVDVVNPTFVFSLNDYPQFNYITCDELRRKYFVRDIVSLSNNVWQVVCECDVLTTYKDSIRENTAIIKRQENNWNLYYNDGSFRTYQNPHVITKSFPSGFTPSAPSFVLAVTGGAENIE